MTVLEKLDNLARLPVNWDSYCSQPISSEALDMTREFVKRWALPHSTRVVPVSGGNVQLEWHRGKRSLEFEFDGKSVTYLRWDPDNSVEEEGILLIDDEVTSKLLLWIDE